MEMCQIMFETMSKHIKSVFEKAATEYEDNPKYKVLKIMDDEVRGFAVYHDDNGIRYIHEIHYLGKDKFAALRMWKWIQKGANRFRAVVQKSNKKIYDAALRLGFTVANEDSINYYMRRGD